MGNVENNQGYILCYTRLPQEDIIYSTKLAYSMHLGYSEDGTYYQSLNHNSGVLFAKATDNEDGTMNAKSLKNPYLFPLAGEGYGVLAIRIEDDGTADASSKGSVLVFTSKDLLQYEEIGLLSLNKDVNVADVKCQYDNESKLYIVTWKDEEGNYYQNQIQDILSLSNESVPVAAEPFEIPLVAAGIEGLQLRNSIAVPRAVYDRVVKRLSVPKHVKNQLPDHVTVSSPEDLNAVKLEAIYSDGTTHTKRIDWDMKDIDWSKKGTITVEGKIHQEHYVFPIAFNRADPCIGKWNGKYYFIATNDADWNHTIYVREADTIPELLHAEEHLILDTNTYEDIKGLLWAPEFHIIGEDLYIFHAATTGPFFNEECHVMKLRKGGSPICAADWSRPIRVVKKDGSYLCEAGKTISLDMTVIVSGGRHYVAWSERQFLPVDLGAWIYLAEINPEEPWKLISDPVLLSKPDYGWANNHVFVDEGPFALYRDGKIFLTFSSALVDATYVVGLLTIEEGKDLLDSKNWVKTNYPLLTSRSVPGEYGTGHNAYVIDEEGTVWNTYHGRPGVEAPRSSGIRRVHFDIDGYPVLDLPEYLDVNKSIDNIQMEVTIA